MILQILAPHQPNYGPVDGYMPPPGYGPGYYGGPGPGYYGGPGPGYYGGNGYSGGGDWGDGGFSYYGDDDGGENPMLLMLCVVLFFALLWAALFAAVYRTQRHKHFAIGDKFYTRILPFAYRNNIYLYY